MNDAFVVEGGARLPSAVLPLIVALALSGAGLFGSGIWIPVKAHVAQYLLERAFAESITAGTQIKPWRWADTWPIARIAVPRLHVSVIALQGASGQALAFGPGHVDNTPAPGEVGTSVFAAHRDTQFAFLDKVVVGDTVDVTDSSGTIFRYRVTEAKVVRWDSSGIDVNAAGRNLALSTCWPFSAMTQGPLRYVVQARLLETRDDPALRAKRDKPASRS